ncbi:MAG: (2Fe-2S)-binding protein [Phycisphaerae bacterium]|nr:(2Fe-2S)-binding protein [Phycisphaerae bacterium]
MLAELVTISVNGRSVSIPQGTAVAAAVALAGESQFRSSVSGMGRGPLCGMGGCGECRVTINGQPHQRSCITPCQEGMEVRTDG